MSRQTFIPKEKLSKKKQKELNKQKRVLWVFNPVSRVKKDKTVYDRKRLRPDPDDPGGVFCIAFCEFTCHIPSHS